MSTEIFVVSRLGFRIIFVISRFYSIHFTVTLAGTWNIVRYIEDFVKSRFHCIYIRRIKHNLKKNYVLEQQ